MPESGAEQIVYRFGDFELFPAERILTNRGERVAMTPRMFDLLVALIEADGHLVRKETLLETVWADAAVEEGNLNRTISALRKALGESRNEIRYIETVPKAGYRFVAKVDRSNGTAKDARPVMEPGASAEPAIVPRARTTSQVKTQRRPIAVIAAFGAFALLFGLLAVSYFFFNRAPEPSRAPASGPVRLTNNSFDEDSAMWTADDKIRFIRFTAVNKVESMIMNADGSDQRRETAPVKDFRVGTWSPDGRRVMYSKEGESPRVQFLANSDGTGEQRLPYRIGPFDWSPDGRSIVYNINFPTETDSSEIVIYSFETGQLTNISNNPAFDANPSFSPDGRQIIFNSDRDGNSEIYLMNIDGSGIRRMTNDPAKEAFHAFSPDGTQIVFNSNRENEKVGIYLLNANDPLPQAIKLSDTKYNAEIRPGCWSRDGTKIVYMSDAGGEKFNVYSMAVEQGGASLLTDPNTDVMGAAISPDGTYAALAVKTGDGGELRVLEIASGKQRTVAVTENTDLAPSWSPDGAMIAFANKADGNTEVFTVSSKGGEVRNVTTNPARDAGPAWSPDGSKIIFSSDRENRSEGSHLFIMNADGTDARRLLARNGYELTAAWAPAGDRIAYACDRLDGISRALDIYVSDPADPGTERLVTSRRFHDTNPAFSPDGKRLAFASQSDGNFEIYLVNVDGTGLVRLTRNIGDDMMPVFSKDGRKIYFVSNRDGKFRLFEMNVGSAD